MNQFIAVLSVFWSCWCCLALTVQAGEGTAGAYPVDLSVSANMGFADPVAGDGRGGWSDQGPDNDFHDFDFRQKTFCGIPFSVITPENNSGKSVITFRCPQLNNGSGRVALPVKPPVKGKYLYLLHTVCWAPPAGINIGEITVTFTDSTSRKYPVVCGAELRDWWNPHPADNGLIGFESENRGVYLSCFPLPDKEVKEIVLTPTGEGMWIVLGATITDKEVPNKQAPKADVNPVTVSNNASSHALIMVDGSTAGIAITPLKASPGVRAANSTFGDPARYQYSAVFQLPASSGEWSQFNFSFKADRDGQVAVNLAGLYIPVAAGNKRVDILWDDLSIQGSMLRNGDFETASANAPADWDIQTSSRYKELQARYIPASGQRGRNRSATLMTWYEGAATQYIPVKKDVPVVIGGFCRLADANQAQAAIQPRLVLKADSEWRPADMNDLIVKPGSALDMDFLMPVEPAGARGRIVINRNGNFAFAGQPDTAIFFSGCSFGDVELSQLKTKADVSRFAGQLRRQGYNLARLHFLDHYLMAGSKADFDFNPERLDLADYLIACLKERGIYLYFDDMTSWNGFKRGSGWSLKGVDLKKEIMTSIEARQHWLTGVTRLLTRVNPYTGLRLVDDPAVAVMLFYNELEFYSISQGPPAAMLKPWREWLKRRYHNDPASLAGTWNDPVRFRPEMKFDEIPLFTKGDQWGTGGTYHTDIGLFMTDQEKEMTDWFEQSVRKLGYTGLISLWDMGKQYRNNVARAGLPVISMHNYFAHPTQWLSPGSTVNQDSSIVNAAHYFRLMTTTRFIDRPFLIAEYGHVFWNSHRYEEGLIFGAYSALQGFQGIMVHSSPVCLKARNPVKPFDAGSDPVERANQVMSMFLFARRDVKTSPNYIELNLDRQFLLDKGNLNRGANDDSRLALLSRFGVWCGGENQPVMSVKPSPVTILSPTGSAMVATTANTMDVLETANGGQGLNRIAASLKQRGLISRDNLTDPAQGMFQSDTGELFMNTKRHTFTVITPRFEGIATDKNDTGKLDVITAVQSSIPSSTALISLDGLPLASSRRMLLVYNTDALNSGMELSSDHSILYDIGKGPTLIRTGILRIELKNTQAGRFEIWALGFDGSRREKILPVSATSGRMQLMIDTGKLTGGPTPFFELVAAP